MYVRSDASDHVGVLRDVDGVCIDVADGGDLDCVVAVLGDATDRGVAALSAASAVCG